MVTLYQATLLHILIKNLFFHIIDISLVNAFILFQSYRKTDPKCISLKRAKDFSVLEFREVAIRQILGFEKFGSPPVIKQATKKCEQRSNNHFRIFGDKKRNWFLILSQLRLISARHKDKNCFFEWYKDSSSLNEL